MLGVWPRKAGTHEYRCMSFPTVNGPQASRATRVPTPKTKPTQLSMAGDCPDYAKEMAAFDVDLHLQVAKVFHPEPRLLSTMCQKQIKIWTLKNGWFAFWKHELFGGGGAHPSARRFHVKLWPFEQQNTEVNACVWLPPSPCC